MNCTENPLTHSIKRVIDKLATSLTIKTEEMINQKIRKLSAEQNLIATGLSKDSQTPRTKVDEIETYTRLDNFIFYGLKTRFDVV